MSQKTFNLDVFSLRNHAEFEDAAFQLFHYQFEKNKVYRSFCNLINVDSNEVSSLDEIPFLPISFFKTHRVSCLEKAPEKIFNSSATTSQTPSKHYVHNLDHYKKSFVTSFEKDYGPAKDYAILALLPSYLERDNSSLVYMANHLIEQSQHPESGFYLDEWESLHETLRSLELKKQKTILLGVSFALLDFIERFKLRLNHTLIMETGGMKGRRKELVREELHTRLCSGFGVSQIHSEYGMTELLSQAYAKKEGRFIAPQWMHFQIRSTEDPLEALAKGKIGALNIIDLANQQSCAFIATQDLGKIHHDNSFEVLGRFDHAEIRGCNLLVL